MSKVLEATVMEYCNGLPTPTKVEAPLGTDVNGSEANRDWPNSCASIIGMMLYLAFKKDHIYLLLFTNVPVLHITQRYHTRQL